MKDSVPISQRETGQYRPKRQRSGEEKLLFKNCYRSQFFNNFYFSIVHRYLRMS